MWKQLQALSDLRNFKLHTFKLTQFKKVENNNFFKNTPNFFVR